MRNPFSKTLSGTLECPHCESTNIAFVGDTGPAEKRYRCRKCGGFFRYQYRNKPAESDRDRNSAYAGHTRGINLARGLEFFRKAKAHK